MSLKSHTKLEEKLICCFKNDKNLGNFDPSTQSLKNLHFDWSLSCKVYNKTFHDTEMSCKICRKTDLWFEE